MSLSEAPKTIHANYPDVVKRVAQGECEFAAYSVKGKGAPIHIYVKHVCSN